VPALAGAHERPVAQHAARVAGSLGDAEAGARDALVVPQLAALHVGDGGMREHQLLGREARLHALRGVDARAEEGHLEAEAAPAGLARGR
jgi:hypothetical protein